MTRKLISSGSTFEAQIGHSRAVVAGDWVFVSGTTGFDYSTMTIADGLIEQTEQFFTGVAKTSARITHESPQVNSKQDVEHAPVMGRFGYYWRCAAPNEASVTVVQGAKNKEK